MRSLELAIPPVALAVLFAIGMIFLTYVAPTAVPVPARIGITATLVLIGALVALAGVYSFRQQKTTVNPFTPEKSSSLIVTGIYRFSRNPMYLRFFIALLGLCVYLANWASAFLLPAFVAYMNCFQIKPEERALEKLFGQQFLDYCKSVRRWL
ncbi:hypothetical protein DN062_01815 [Nitrincola tibetensis]|uniref:Isoprenylcysteine carboxylmethyltransferase family protein n=1 Tax=Nitrincola tibetensis TaxID=2219697 RepID=A0A364NSH2_9GAMM|nr:isoprenylcysteine carboxylmethyltransferase family protein [Nitrincola tibetensis]RAU19835.1 hypothetical protein DN062_01815 [Nitrincola tibetensis]